MDPGSRENELRRRVFAEIRSSGRRLTVAEAMTRLGGGDEEILRVLERMVEQGFLAKTPSSGRTAASEPPPAPEGWINDPSRDWFGRGPAGHDWHYWKDYGRRMREDRRRWRHEWRRGFREEWAEQEPGDESGDESEENGVVDARARRAGGGFQAHLISYASVIGFLFFINMTTSPGFLWFLFPALGWGIGLANHAVLAAGRAREKAELEAAAAYDEERAAALRRFQRARRSFRSQVASTLMTVLLLGAINLAASPGVPWAAIPAGFMLIGLFARWPVHVGRSEKLKEQLGGALPKPAPARRRREGPVLSAGTQAVVDQAHRFNEQILEQLKGFGKSGSPLGDDIRPVLANYLKQIDELGGKHDELEALINGIPMHDLEKDLAALAKRRDETADPKLKEEYARSIQEIEQHRQSFAELERERERLFLRLSSSVNSLKQMQIDLARMKSISAGADRSALDDLKRKSGELTQYLKDLGEGYKEIEE